MFKIFENDGIIIESEEIGKQLSIVRLSEC